MNRIITRGFGPSPLVITRGFGFASIGQIYREIIRLTSKVTMSLRLLSPWKGGNC